MNIGTLQIPFHVHITEFVDSGKQNMRITFMTNHKYTYVYLENLREITGRVAEHTMYFYDGKPLWCVKSIKGTMFFHMNVLHKILALLNVRKLLPDVSALVYFQLTQLPQELRSKILTHVKEYDTVDVKNQLYSLFAQEYFAQYEHMKGVFELYSNTHPYNLDCKLTQNIFKDEISDQSTVCQFLGLLKIKFHFQGPYTFIFGKRHHTNIIAHMASLYHNECKCSKLKWYQQMKVYLNIYFVVQTILSQQHLQFTNQNIQILAIQWVNFIKERVKS